MIKRLLAFIFLTMSFGANAAMLSWTIQDAVLTDGQTVTGGFNFNSNTSTYSSIAISNSGTLEFPASTYDRVQASRLPCAGSASFCVFNDSDPVLDDVMLILTLSENMTNLGGTIDINTLFPAFALCTDANCFANDTQEVYFSQGTVTTNVVPLPAAAWLFGSALLGLIGYSRRKGAKTHA